MCVRWQVQGEALAPAAAFLELATAAPHKLLDTGLPLTGGTLAVARVKLAAPYRLPQRDALLTCVVSLSSTARRIQIQTTDSTTHLQAEIVAVHNLASGNYRLPDLVSHHQYALMKTTCFLARPASFWKDVYPDGTISRVILKSYHLLLSHWLLSHY